MVGDTRSGRHFKVGLDGRNLKRKLRNGKLLRRSLGNIDVLGMRRSATETSLSRQTTAGPVSLQKSKCLEKGMPSSTPPAKRKSKRPEKQHTPSHLRMPDRGKNNASQSSSGSQQSAKELRLSDQRKKENVFKQVAMEFNKAKLDVDSLYINGKKINARTYKGLFKRQRVKEIVADVDGELGESNRISHGCADDPDRNCVEDFKNSFNVSEKLPGNCLSINMDAPKPKRSTLEISPVGAVDSESGDPKGLMDTIDTHLDFTVISASKAVVESIPPSSTNCENQGILGTCALCSKMKRVFHNSPKQELCSCSDVVNDYIGSSSNREDTTSENLNELSLRDSHANFEKLNVISDTNDNLGELKKRASKFLEYWIPSQISNLQLELYLFTLLSNSTPLRSCSRNDSVGALRDIVLTVRKCCDHPYLVDSTFQERMITEKCPAAELLDVGIKASGKLQLLDAMLTESMTRGLKTLILYQSIHGAGGASIGDILDDFLRQKFGQNTYERVDARVSLHKKQAAVSRFNKKETGQFTFLLENRACSSAIKLLAVDIIVLYDSDWNPANDIRALQKISIDSKFEQMKVFRLYSSCTVEERALVLAKKNLKLDNNLQTFSRTTSDTLLMWGTSNLFNKLDDYHASSDTAANILPGQSVLNEVTKEFQAILSESCKNIGLSVISKVCLSAGNYSVDIPLLGEAKNQLKDGEETHVFWKNLLDRKDPSWRHFRGSIPRNRKRVQYLNESLDTENNYVVKRHKRIIHENSNPVSVQIELEEDQVTQVACSKGGGSFTIFACDKSQPFWTESVSSNSYPNCEYRHCSHGPDIDVGDPEERIVLFDEQKILYNFLEGETMKLCQILKLSEVVMDMVRRFLKYVIKNHQVSIDSPAYVQALQISLCWISASVMKQKVDKKDSLMSAKQLLNYQCTEEQVTSVYSKMRTLKRIYLHCSENFIASGNLLMEDGISMEPSNVDEEHVEGQIPTRRKMTMEDKAAASEIENKVKKLKKKCNKQMKRLLWKQQEEVQELHQIWEEKREELEADHKLKSGVIQSIHSEGLVRMDKLKLLNADFAKELQEFDLLKDRELKNLVARQLDVMNEERQRTGHWLARAKAYKSEVTLVNGPEPFGCQSEEDVGCLRSCIQVAVSNPVDVVPMSGQQTKDQSPSQHIVLSGDDVALSVTSISAPSEAACCSSPVETISNMADSTIQSEKGILFLDRLSLAVVEKPNQSKNPGDTDEIVSRGLRTLRQQVSDEIPLVELNREVPELVPDRVPDGVVGHFTPLQMDRMPDIEFGNVDAVGLVDAVENMRNRPDELTIGAVPLPRRQLIGDAVENMRNRPGEQTIGALPLPGRQFVGSEQIAPSPDCCALLPQQVPGEQIPQNLVSDELQLESQSTSQIEVSTSQFVHAAKTVESYSERPETETYEQLHSVSVDVSLSGNQFPTGEDEVLSHESGSESRENLELHQNHLDPCPGSRVQELPNQVAFHLGMNAGQLHGPSHLLAHSTNQVTTWNSTPSFSADPLQIELERMQKEFEILEKSHEDVVSQLKSECEMKILEIISQIQNDYDSKLKDTEADFMLKKNEVGKNQTLVLMNRMLAEAFRSKCLDLRPSGRLGMQQGNPESLRQQLQSAPTLRSATPATQAMQTMRRISLSESTRPSPIVSLNSMVPAVQRAPARISSTPARPPLVGVITPLGNTNSGGENRWMAPHLQLFRPSTASSIIPPSIPQPPGIRILNSQPPPLSAQQMQATPVSQVRPDQQIVQPTPNLNLSALESTTVTINRAPPIQILNAQRPPPSALQMQTNLVSLVRPDPQIVQPTPNLDPFSLELPTVVINQAPCIPTNHTLPPPPDVLIFDSADLEMSSDVLMPSVVATSVICLSDEV